MARQTGLIKLKGTLDNVNFYKSKDGNLARMKTSVDGKRIASDPAFVRTRENNKEFGTSAIAGKLLRTALRPLMQSASDGGVTARMTKVMTMVKNFDTQGSRGGRNVAAGIVNPAAKELLKGFNFNERSAIGSVFFKPFQVDTNTGAITITDLIPINDVAFPQGATHVSLKCAWTKVDFVTGVSNTQISPESNLPIDSTSADVTLTPPQAPTGQGTDIFVLCLEFFQEVNATQYSLKNGAFNVLSIVEVN
ncbi:hypothetical protein [Fluviicola taffensis]|uniref:Uncharacterized protein n=1 Tax=Fluviicola taffensis (strain DSM 16823 / NCIMB 13979 / RW262) TaxID=755732 RepID=F2IGG3_FLUTR|nr:hypothetical protein [Fluviicola taffensis]AEA42569.1 hypothetical protein Fluta_0564 [Fluviicola taffensis DSM 16823]